MKATTDAFQESDSVVQLSVTGEPVADTRGKVSWALFEFARSPYISLVYVYVFPPYFANVVVGDPVLGQRYWSSANTVVGICVALMAPLLGAVADHTGARKPWLAGIVAIMASSCIALWWAMPLAQGGLPLTVILALIVILATFFQFSDMFHSSMLPSISSAKHIGGLSGLGISLGNSGTFLAMVVMLLFVALPGEGINIAGMLPNNPLFGLDPANHEHNRIAGPVAGVWLLLLVFPIFLWTPDRASTGISPRHALRKGLSQLWMTLKHARQIANVGLYLLARMLYTDGKVAAIAYTGIYATGVFGWGLSTTLLFGLIVAPCAILGGLLGGWVDNRVGSKRAIQISVGTICLSMIGIVSITPQEIFFVIPYDTAVSGALWDFPYFQTLPEVIYILMSMISSATVTAAFANSRTMLARISPVSMMGQFYGLYGFSGTATSFLGHGLVGTFTFAFASQRAGFASLLILMIAGLLLMHWVREDRAEEILESPIP